MTPTYLVAWMYVLVIVFSACTYAPREREREKKRESPRGLHDRSNKLYPTKEREFAKKQEDKDNKMEKG